MTAPLGLGLDFGTDLSSLDDLDETRVVTGLELVAQDAIWRLKTPPTAAGILTEDAPTYGLDLLEAIGSVANDDDAAALPEKIRGQLTQDDRIQAVTSTITKMGSGPGVEWSITIRCETADGPFELVGNVADEQLNLAFRLLPGAT